MSGSLHAWYSLRDLESLADRGVTLSGELDIGRLTRLRGLLHSDSGSVRATLRFRQRGDGWLASEVEFRADVELVCQRCLEAAGVGDPQCFAGQAGVAKFNVGDKVKVRDLPAMFYTRTPEYCRGAEGTIAEVTYESPAPEDEAWDREDAKAEWFYIVRFNQAALWDNYTGPANDTLQTEIPERWLEAVG